MSAGTWSDRRELRCTMLLIRLLFKKKLLLHMHLAGLAPIPVYAGR